MAKRILALILCMCLIFAFAACDSGKKDKDDVGGSNVKVDTSLQKGEPKAVGDVFELPDVKRTGDSAPIISEATHQADPDDSILLTGEGFSAADTKVYIYSQSTKDNGKATEAKFTATSDEIMSVVIDKDLEYGIYGIYVENSKGKSDIWLINQPVIWWIDLSAVTAGEEFSIYGENLTTDNADKSSVFLVTDGEYCQAQVIYADPYKVTIKIPEGLKSGTQYEVRLHNGHGGTNGFAVAKEKITFYEKEPFVFDGDVIDVTEYGAVAGKKNNDDTAAVQKAIDAAKDGDIIYFPKGTYMFKNSLTVSKQLQFKGDGKDKTKIVGGNTLDGYVFSIKIGPVEFTDMGFEHIRKSGKIKSGFIQIRCNNTESDVANLYVHDCDFVQEVSKVGRSIYYCISVINTYGIVVEDNTFDVTGAISNGTSGKLFFRNNDVKGHLYAGGIYYNQNTMYMLNTDMYDTSDNKFQGKDIFTDDSGKLTSEDLTTGRVIAIQGYGRNLYMSNNDIDRSGLPDDNAGEQIMLECIRCDYVGGIKASTETDVTMPSDFTVQMSRDMLINIIEGKGKGQVRSITKMKGKTVTLDKPWNIVPDQTSVIFITNCFVNIVIYNNDMDCYTNYAENPGATTGVQAYGGIYNMYITKNKFKNMPYGLCISLHYCPESKDHPNTCMNNIYWSNIDDNIIENTCIGIRYIMNVQVDHSEKNVGMMGLGVLYRANKIKNVKEWVKDSWKGTGGVGISVGIVDPIDGHGRSATWHGNWIESTLIENTKFENCDVTDVYFYKHQENTILRNNTSNGKKEINTKVSPIGEGPVIAK